MFQARRLTCKRSLVRVQCRPPPTRFVLKLTAQLRDRAKTSLSAALRDRITEVLQTTLAAAVVVGLAESERAGRARPAPDSCDADVGRQLTARPRGGQPWATSVAPRYCDGSPSAHTAAYTCSSRCISLRAWRHSSAAVPLTVMNGKLMMSCPA